MMEFLNQYGGIIFSVLGAALAAALPGVGSAKGVGHVGQGASAIIIDDPAKFGRSLILQLLPGTQGLYGMIIAIIVMIFKFDAAMPLQQGLRVLFSCLPIAIVGYASAVHQGNVAYSGLEILAKNESQSMKGVIYAVMVETYAILSFIISLLFVFAA